MTRRTPRRAVSKSATNASQRERAWIIRPRPRLYERLQKAHGR